MFISVLEQSLMLLPLVCGIYFSYMILKLTDVSVDGSLVLGAAVTSKLLLTGMHPLFATLLSMMSGFFAGVFVALIQYRNSIDDIIAGLLMSFMLYSINLNIMGQPNLMTMQAYSFLTMMEFSKYKKLLLVSGASFITIIICISVMKSNLGLKLRGFGNNKKLMARLGFRPELYRMIGLGISGMLASLSGSSMCQMYGYSDINMGFGMAITSIGALVIGLHFVKKLFAQKFFCYNAEFEILSCFIGIFCYFIVTNSLVMLEIEPRNFRLILALIIIGFLRLARKTVNDE